MSSYLSIYIKPKGKEEKILLYTFSRSSDVYQFFYDNNLSTCAYNLEDKSERFKELDKNELVSALNELKDEINSDTKRLSIMEKHPSLTTLGDIMISQQYLEEKKALERDINFLSLLLPEYQYSDVEKVFTNYD